MDDCRGRAIGAILEEPEEPDVSPPRPSAYSAGRLVTWLLGGLAIEDSLHSCVGFRCIFGYADGSCMMAMLFMVVGFGVATTFREP